MEKTHRTAMEDKEQLISNLESIIEENDRKICELEKALSGKSINFYRYIFLI